MDIMMSMKSTLVGAAILIGATVTASAQSEYPAYPQYSAPPQIAAVPYTATTAPTIPQSWSYDPYTSGLGPCPQRVASDPPCSETSPPSYGQPSFRSP